MPLPGWLQTRALRSQRPATTGSAPPAPTEPSAAEPAATSSPTPPPKDFTDLLARNPDVVGWIAIDGTAVDFSVLQGRDNEYYLRHDLDRQYDLEGIPFADYECDVEKGRHLILYGHNMGVGQTARFSSLQNYRHPDYYTRHPVIALDTLWGSGLYKVAARAFYTTGDYVHPDERLLSLCICTYEMEDARLAVMARPLRPGETAGADAVTENPNPRLPARWPTGA